MRNIFNFKSDFTDLTKPASEVQSNEDMKKLVDEIHETFYTEVDRILADAKIQNTFNDLPTEKIEKAQNLAALGFVQSKDVLQQRENQQKKELREKDNEEKKLTLEAVNYFSQKYPLYKFITEASVKKICQKYGLIYGEVGYYKGSVPQKNLNDILNFKIDENDKILICNTDQFLWNVDRNHDQWVYSDPIPSIQGKYVRGRATTYMISNESIPEIKEREKKYFETLEKDEIQQGYAPPRFAASPAPLEITAPLSDFDVREMQVTDSQLTQAPAPDPVVLCPVWFKARKHYLIVTAWGLEASDELVMNPNHN